MLIAEVAHWMALLPLAWLMWLVAQRRPRDPAWWWLAGAFAVSWLADSAAHLIPQGQNTWISIVYPVSQTAVVGAVLLPRRRAIGLAGVLVLTALLGLFWRGLTRPDVILRAVAWLSVVSIVWARPELPNPLRASLAVYFGLGLVAWLVHVRWLIVPTYYPYQATRLVGLLLFCWASNRPTPSFRIMQ